MFELSTLIEQQRPATITRQLAAWAAILAVPTAIAGIYGMNFEYMPELTTRYGYFVVLGVIVVTCLWLYDRFRRDRLALRQPGGAATAWRSISIPSAGGSPNAR